MRGYTVSLYIGATDEVCKLKVISTLSPSSHPVGNLGLIEVDSVIKSTLANLRKVMYQF